MMVLSMRASDRWRVNGIQCVMSDQKHATLDLVVYLLCELP